MEGRKGEGAQAGDPRETSPNPLDDKKAIQRKKGTGNSMEGLSPNITFSFFRKK
jgi:hypothetical protein